MSAMKNKPKLGKMPGLERLDMPDEDFEPKERPALTAWALIFFALAAVSGVLSWTVTLSNQPSLLLQLMFWLFAGLGIITFLSRFVRVPA